MVLNITVFSYESSSNETSISEVDTQSGVHPLESYLTLFILSLGAIFVLIPTLAVIIVVLKNRKLKEKNANIFYVNFLIADVFAILSRWLLTSMIIVSYLLDLPSVDCTVVVLPLNISLFSTRFMFLPLVFDRLLHVARPFSYKNIVTDKRVMWTIAGFWLLVLGLGLFSIVVGDFVIMPEQGICVPKENSTFVYLIILATLIISTCIITGTSIYLHYKIIHSNRFFNSVKRTAAEKEKAVKVGRLVEILQEQAKPTFSVFIAGGIDVIFNMLAVLALLLIRVVGHSFYLRAFITIPSFVGQHFTHAVLYAMRDNDIRKEILRIYRNFRGSENSRVIVLNRQ